jgi:hypothetical protein
MPLPRFLHRIAADYQLSDIPRCADIPSAGYTAHRGIILCWAANDYLKNLAAFDRDLYLGDRMSPVCVVLGKLSFGSLSRNLFKFIYQRGAHDEYYA